MRLQWTRVSMISRGLEIVILALFRKWSVRFLTTNLLLSGLNVLSRQNEWPNRVSSYQLTLELPSQTKFEKVKILIVQSLEETFWP